jgi:hypothetical protein
MTDPVDDVLRLVASGRLTADEAAPILDALQAGAQAEETATEASLGRSSGAAKAIRIEVSEGGSRIVNLRVPVALGRMAIDHVPGLAPDMVARIRAALDEGLTGPVLVVDEGEAGGGVRIVIE